jgi:outer membrane protein assembly factor BamB
MCNHVSNLIKFKILCISMIISVLSTNGQSLQKVDLTAGDYSNPMLFEFQMDKYNIAINSAGNMRGWRINLSLKYKQGFHTRKINYINSEERLLICTEITNDTITYNKLLCFDKDTIKEVWSITLDNTNISVGKIENDLLYIGAKNSVYKIDFQTGNIIWKSDNIYNKYKINTFLSIKLLKNKVELIGVTELSEQQNEKKSIIIDKNSGKILQLK